MPTWCFSVCQICLVFVCFPGDYIKCLFRRGQTGSTPHPRQNGELSTGAERLCYRLYVIRADGKQQLPLCFCLKDGNTAPHCRIFYSNVRALVYEHDGSAIFINSRQDFANCSVPCFTETWLGNTAALDSWPTWSGGFLSTQSPSHQGLTPD